MTPNPKPYSAPAGVDPSSAPQGQQLYVTANPELNFAQMSLALALHAHNSKPRVSDGLKNAWIGLVKQFERESDSLHEDGIGETINPISTNYFQLQTQRPQGNFMQDMLSSLMGGGGAGGANNQITGSGEKEAAPPVQPLVIKQAPKPAFKPVASGDGGDDGDESLDAPEEEELD